MQLFESAWQKYEEDTPNHLLLAAGGRVTLVRDDPYKKARKILHNWGHTPDEPLGIRGHGKRPLAENRNHPLTRK